MTCMFVIVVGSNSDGGMVVVVVAAAAAAVVVVERGECTYISLRRLIQVCHSPISY